MSNINFIIAREMAKSNGSAKVIKGRIGSIPVITEWIKWLSYESALEKERIAYLDTKKITDLSLEELESATFYQRNKLYKDLFIKYNDGKCNEEEYKKVYDFMNKVSIEDLMLNKLSKEELIYAKEKLNMLRNFDKLKLEEKIKDGINNYQELSMKDSYVLHILCDIDYARSMNRLDKELNAQKERNMKIRWNY